MNVLIVPYKSFGPLQFGQSTRDDCIREFGEPNEISRNREGAIEFAYEGFVVRFDKSTNLLRECTILPFASATIDGLEVTWDHGFLDLACRRDGAPRDIYGFIVMKELGIAVTGIHDDDRSQLAVTIFTRGEFDDLWDQGMPYILNPVESDIRSPPSAV